MKSSLVTTITLLFLLTCTQSACPSSCPCQIPTFQCLLCLQSYHRIYSNENRTCICQDGFIQMDPPTDHCCPSNCSICVDLGCVSCSPGWELQYNGAVEVYICVCKFGYYYDGSNCVCQSKYYPEEYYEDKVEMQCLRCPAGCRCGATGCYQCEEWAGRMVKTVNGESRCPCSAARYQMQDGMCACKKDCYCDYDYCGLQTNRVLIDGDYVCSGQYTDINGSCVCQDPYTSNITLINTSYSCYCKSVVTPTLYYEFLGECSPCTQGCICNQSGCVYCPFNLHRQILYFSCPCTPPYTEFKGKCICKQPYYIDKLKGCICKSFMYPNKYFGDQGALSANCFKCPENCTCDSSGCSSCQAEALRNITVGRLEVYTCTCVNSAEEDEGGRCRCNQYSTAVDGKCVCYTTPGVFRQLDVCQTCPNNCNCSTQLGCYQCNQYAFRVIITDPNGYSSCICRPDTSQNTQGTCSCRPPLTQMFDFSTATLSCQCLDPYTMKNGLCVCKSLDDATSYYLNTITQKCQACPVGCSCNESGCYSCSPNSLHYVFTSDGLYQCACVQSARLGESICQKCPAGSYYLNGECVKCPSCLECDMFGCTKCGSFAEIKEHTCVCTQSNYVNINGECSCPIGKYQVTLNVCADCPPNCYDCRYDMDDKVAICNACPAGMNRRDSPADGCPCLDHYKQLPNIKSYCCHETCSNCTDTVCTACFMFTFRTLVNGSCICNEGTFEINNSVACGCPDGMYMLLGKCMKCPLNCVACEFSPDADLVICTKCEEGANRNTTMDYYGLSQCPCLPAFAQAYPLQTFCMPLYCKTQTKNCTECNFGRIVGNNGLTCICKQGFYENLYGECTLCNMEGCLICSKFNFCLKCDMAADYYLTGTTCKRNMVARREYIYSQTQQGIYLQLNLTSVELKVFSRLSSIQAKLQNIHQSLTSNWTIEAPTLLNISSSNINIDGNILILKIKNPNVTKKNAMLSVEYYLSKGKRLLAFIGFDERGNPTAFIDSSYIKLDLIRSQTQIDVSNKWYYGMQYAITIIFMLGSLLLYIFGFKHNQIPFFIQTVSLIGFTYSDDTFLYVSALYNLRYSYYAFGNALSGIIPKDYLETSQANYSLLAIDSNIIRLGGTTLLIGGLAAVVGGVLRVVDRVVRGCGSGEGGRGWVRRVVQTKKKTVYRVLEFFYKTCMYPLIFFSIVTLSNWNATVFIPNNGYYIFCRALSILLLLLYTLTTTLSYFLQTIAKLNKLQNTLQFTSSLICSLIISFSIFSNHILWLILVFVFRTLAYLMIRRRFLRDFQKMEYLRLLSCVFEVACIGCVLTRSTRATVGMFLCTVVSQAVHASVIVYLTARLAELDKRSEWREEQQQQEVATSIEKEELPNEDWLKSNKISPAEEIGSESIIGDMPEKKNQTQQNLKTQESQMMILPKRISLNGRFLKLPSIMSTQSVSLNE